MNKYPKAYLEYLIEFHGTRDYFECHEIMEEYWKKDKQKHWHTLIQLAVAVYHERRGNYTGSLRLYRKVLSSLRNDAEALEQLAIDTDRLESTVRSRIVNVLEEGEYSSFDLPITDEVLLFECQELCQERGFFWGNTEDANNMELVERHKRRDRSDVIQERLQSLSRKLKQRGRKV